MIRTLAELGSRGEGGEAGRIARIWRAHVMVTIESERVDDRPIEGPAQGTEREGGDVFCSFDEVEAQAWPQALEHAEKLSTRLMMQMYGIEDRRGDRTDAAWADLYMDSLSAHELAVRSFALTMQIADPYTWRDSL